MFEMNKQKIGSFIAELRKEKGYTQKELSERLFISDKAVSKWETGQSMPDISLLRPLADILGVTTSELLEGERIDSNAVLQADQAEELVQKVLLFSEQEKEALRTRKKRNAVLYFVGLFLGITETFLYMGISGEAIMRRSGLYSVNFSNVFTIELLACIFGVYFCLFAKEKLPTFYDENRINFYSDGFFQMNLPGVTFNNSNWPHILQAAQRWCLFAMIGTPLVYLSAFFLFEGVAEAVAGVIVLVVIVFCGLFIPIYRAAKKYS